jgi:hypothetical protein
MFWIPMAAMAGMSLLKGMGDQARADKQRQAEAAVTRYSPWTGMQGKSVQDPDMFGTLAGGVASGAMMGQGMEKQAADEAFQKSYLEKMGMGGGGEQGLPIPMRGASPYS